MPLPLNNHKIFVGFWPSYPPRPQGAPLYVNYHFHEFQVKTAKGSNQIEIFIW